MSTTNTTELAEQVITTPRAHEAEPRAAGIKAVGDCLSHMILVAEAFVTPERLDAAQGRSTPP